MIPTPTDKSRWKSRARIFWPLFAGGYPSQVDALKPFSNNKESLESELAASLSGNSEFTPNIDDTSASPVEPSGLEITVSLLRPGVDGEIQSQAMDRLVRQLAPIVLRFVKTHMPGATEGANAYELLSAEFWPERGWPKQVDVSTHSILSAKPTPPRDEDAEAYATPRDLRESMDLEERLSRLEETVFPASEARTRAAAADPRDRTESQDSVQSLLNGPTQVAASLIRAEQDIGEADRARLALNRELERNAERSAASSLAIGAAVALDHLELPGEVVIPFPEVDDFLRGRRDDDVLSYGAGPWSTLGSVGQFRETEIALMRLSGLSHEAAVRHVDRSLAMYRSQDAVLQSLADVQSALERVEDRWSEDVNRQKDTPRSVRRRRLRRGLVALGGCS